MQFAYPLALALGGVALGLLGCQHFEPKPISVEQRATELETRSLTNSELKNYLEANLGREIGTWPKPRWDFEMLTLAAFYFQPSLHVARAQRDVAKAAIRTAGGRPNPTIGVTPEYSFNPPEGTSPGFQA
jgi:hypothetical protein